MAHVVSATQYSKNPTPQSFLYHGHPVIFLPGSYGLQCNNYFLCGLVGVAIGLWSLQRQVGVGFIHRGPRGLEQWHTGQVCWIGV